MQIHIFRKTIATFFGINVFEIFYFYFFNLFVLFLRHFIYLYTL